MLFSQSCAHFYYVIFAAVKFVCLIALTQISYTVQYCMFKSPPPLGGLR